MIASFIASHVFCTGLWDLFDPHHVVSAKEVAAGKPAPDVYIECLRRLGCLDPSRCAPRWDNAWLPDAGLQYIILVVDSASHGWFMY